MKRCRAFAAAVLAAWFFACGVAHAQLCVNAAGHPVTTAAGVPLLCGTTGGSEAGPAYQPYPRIFGYAEGGGALSAYASANWSTYAPLYNALVYANYVGGSIGGANTFAGVMAGVKSSSPLATPPYQGFYLQSPFQACAFQGTGETSGTTLTIQSSNSGTCSIATGGELYSVSSGNPSDTGTSIESGSGSTWTLSGSPGLGSGTSIAIVAGNQGTFAKWSMLVDTGTGSYGWWLRTAWPSGSIVITSEAANSGDLLLSPNNTSTNSNGRTLYQEFAYHFDEWYTQGQSVGEVASIAANPTLNLYFMDNQFPRPRQSGTWGAPSDTTDYSNTAAQAATYLQKAQAMQVAALRAQHSGVVVAGNSNYFALGTVSGNDVALDPSNDGLYDYAFAEQVEQSMGNYNFTTLFAMIEQQEAQVSSSGTIALGQYFNGTGSGCPSVVSWTSGVQSTWGSAQWQVARFWNGWANMRNYAWAPGVGANNVLWWFDEEYQGGVHGWLSNGTQRLDPPQTGGATQVTLTGTGNISNVMVRRFPNGWVILNPYGNGSVSITGGIPTTLHRLTNISSSTGDSTINTGAAVSFPVALGDSISSEPCGDGLFLIGTGALFQPFSLREAANDPVYHLDLVA
jgi:hypothetical protein